MAFLDDRLGLRGKVAVVFGGGGGLGRACALDLGAAGVHLALADRDTDALEQTRELLDMVGAPEASLITSTFDGRDANAQAQFFDLVDGIHDGIDILVNVIGGTFPQPFEESNPRGWDALVRTNFTWLLSSTQLAIPRLRRRGGGSIITIESIEGHRAAPGHAVYAAMKAAVANLSRTLAVELGPDQIRVNTIAPDFVPTEGLLAMMADDERRADQVDADRSTADHDLADRISIPMGRRGNVGDVGGCALFLASDLSRFVTGTTLHPDGGTYASAGWFNWPDAGWRNSVPPTVVAAYRAHRTDAYGPTDGSR